MIRKLTGLVIGVGLALVIIMTSEAIGHRLYPLAEQAPTGLEPPARALIPVILGWTLGSLIGGYAAIRIGRAGWEPWTVSGAIVVSVLIAYAIAEPGVFPLWMLIAGIALPLLAAWGVRRIAAPSG